jgi:hypothetical protein
VRFQVLIVASMKMTASWNVVPCSLVEVYHRSEVLASSVIRAVMVIEAVNTSETLVNFHQAAWHNIAEDSHNLRLYIYVCVCVCMCVCVCDVSPTDINCLFSYFVVLFQFLRLCSFK